MKMSIKASQNKSTLLKVPHFFKPISRDGNLQIINLRQENNNDLTSPGTQLSMQTPINVILANVEEENLSSDSPHKELLRWHYCLGHFLFVRLGILAALVILPRNLLKINPPKCDGCLYGAMTKHPWHNKPANNRVSIRKDSAPWECIPVDQVESSTPGLIFQLRGKPTKQIYRTTTILLDQYSGMTYVHLQRGLSPEETVQGKTLFESYDRTYKVKIKYYHTDNGRFAYNTFLQEVAQENQTTSYCEVNDHL